MASCSVNSRTSTEFQSSGSEEALQLQRKRKRMLSNRESARLCRMRKQKQMADLTAQVAQLQNDNAQILKSINDTTQRYLSVEAENSVLRAHVALLSQTLQSLNHVINLISMTAEAHVFRQPREYDAY